MAKLKLKYWPFKEGEKVVLDWIQSPKREGQGPWSINLFFRKEDDTTIEIPYSWDVLPFFKLGTFYKDKEPINQYSRGYSTIINIPDISAGEICDAGSIKKWFYPLYTRDNLTEKCVRYNIEGKEIFIPCIEIVRSIFTPTRLLADALLYPQGLEDLVDEMFEADGELFLHLNSAIPKKSVKNKNALRHLVWLLTNSTARQTWENIFRKVFEEEKIKGSANSMKISLLPPIIGSSHMKARVLKRHNYILILEIEGLTGLDIPYKDIHIFHDSLDLKEKTSSTRSNRNRRSKTPTDTYYLDNMAGPTKSNSDEIEVETVPAILGFNNEIQIHEECSNKSFARAKGKDINDNIIAAVAEQITESSEQVASTSEGEAGGENTLLEFQPILTELIGKMTGLENFLKAIEQISRLVKGLKIDHSINVLPQGKAFSSLEDGTPRSYALVKLSLEQNKPTYLIEVGRPDRRYLSTLVFWSRENDFSTIELNWLVKRLLNILIENNGSWDNDYLRRQRTARIKRIVHVTNEYPHDWAIRLIEKLNFTTYWE